MIWAIYRDRDPACWERCLVKIGWLLAEAFPRIGRCIATGIQGQLAGFPYPQWDSKEKSG